MFIQTNSGRWRIATITAAFLAAITAHAADPKPAAKTKATPIPEVVITATKTETESWRTASSITVIDRKKIEEQQFRLLPDALKQVPGLSVIDNGGPGTLAGVFLRGTRTAHTAVMLDGRPLPMNLAGSFNIENMSLDNVERIEVLRGPAASLYGGRTIGGVINIISRSGRGMKKPESSTFFEAGSYGSFREGLGTRGASGALDWAVELGRTDFQGQRSNSQFQQSNAAGKLGVQLAETLRFDLDLRYYNADLGDPLDQFTNDPDNHLLTEYWSISPRLVWDTTKRWKQSLTFQFSNFRQVSNGNTSPGGPFDNRITSRGYFVEYQSVFKPLDNWTLTAGAWLQDQSFVRYNDASPSFFNPGGNSYDIDQAETNWAVFLQSQLELLPGWNLVAGLRHDTYSDFDSATTWRAGTSWRMPGINTILHANYGTAFSPPSPQDREPAIWAPFGGQLLDTRPERSRGFEFGLEQPFDSLHARLFATYFQNDLKDTYQFAGTGLQAIGKAAMRGLEAGTTWQPDKLLGFTASYTYVEADDTIRQVRLVRRPRHMLTGSMTVRPHESFNLTFSASYVMDREDFDPVSFAQGDLEDYLLARISANWRITPTVEFFARVENMFGDDYQEVAGYPALDTGAYAGIRLRF